MDGKFECLKKPAGPGGCESKVVLQNIKFFTTITDFSFVISKKCKITIFLRKMKNIYIKFPFPLKQCAMTYCIIVILHNYKV